MTNLAFVNGQGNFSNGQLGHALSAATCVFDREWKTASEKYKTAPQPAKPKYETSFDPKNKVALKAGLRMVFHALNEAEDLQRCLQQFSTEEKNPYYREIFTTSLKAGLAVLQIPLPDERKQPLQKISLPVNTGAWSGPSILSH